MSIDYTEFVEAAKDQPSLQFPNEKQQANFELGVTMAIHSWDDLKTAVDNQWGGPDSAEKRDWLSGVVVDLFTQGKAVDIALIEETLLYAMVDEFDVEIEDESALIVGKKVMDYYKQCRDNEFGEIREAYEKWQQKQKESAAAGVNKVVINADPNNPDISDDDEEEDDDDDERERVPNLVETAEDAEMQDVEEKPTEPVVDDDGFELVQKKGKKNRR